MSATAKAGLALALIAGVALRLIWGDDIEWKADEVFTFEQAMRVGRDLPWPWLGMPSSVFLPNPGLSVWVFVAIARVFAVETPPDLARAIAILNIAAFLGLLLFIARTVPAEQRERWFWAIALYAVNPLAVIIERKIWPPSVLGPFMVLFLVGWWHRDRLWGAALWGVIGAAIGQIHMPAMIFAFAIFAWTLLRERGSTRWPAWVAGSLVAAWPLIPWAQAVLASMGERPGGYRIIPTFFLRWATEPWGFTADYTLGRAHYLEFLSAPILAGRPTYALAAAHVALVGLAVATGALFARALWTRRADWREFVIGVTPGAVLFSAALWGYGLLLTFSGFTPHRHHLTVIYILKFLWLASVVFAAHPPRRARVVLGIAAGLQFAITVALLAYIHDVQIIQGEFGPTWRSQQR